MSSGVTSPSLSSTRPRPWPPSSSSAASYLIGKTIRWYDDDKRLRLVVIKFCGLDGVLSRRDPRCLGAQHLDPRLFREVLRRGGPAQPARRSLGMVAGVVALFFLTSPAISTLPMMPKALGGKRWKRAQRMGYVSLILVAVHLVALGLKGWLKPQAWPAGMPSISLARVHRRTGPSHRPAQADLRAAEAGSRRELIATGARRLSSCQGNR